MISILVLVFYITIRIGLNSLWDQVSVYYSYAFEVVFIALTYFYYKKKNNFKFMLEIKKANLIRLAPWPLVGFLVHKLARHTDIIIPFDFRSTNLIVAMLIIAPIIEELIFRMSLWEAVDDFIKNKEVQIWISAILFSLGHLVTIFMIPPEYRAFVLYQSVYVIILSIGSSKMRQESNSIMGSILVHFMFNLGFYLASFN